ncbi:MAG: Rne/Rng family ribonuclease [Phycisphaerales bacterium]
MPNTEMLINYVPGEECRIAIVVDGSLEEFYQERASAGSTVGNIYKGKVTNVEPSIQAAFVDFGEGRNGFLHITDLHPSYFSGKHHEDTEQVGSKTPRHERPLIQRCLKRGQDILVQVLKEGIGTKGPTLTSYLSIPGRFLVMMPQMQRLGVSRKVDDDEARREMKKVLAELNPPEGFGFIIRTAGLGQTKTDLKRDLAYLVRLWKSIERRKSELKGVGELYTEQDLIIRTIRDVFTNDISRVVIDNPQAAKRANDFLTIASPRSKPKVAYYHDPVPLFHRFDIERQIESINAREVPLKSGGSLVFDQAEALVAIDVNSGKSRSARDAESNAFNTNMEAVDEICRQLRLRDLGGVIVNDLIDMRDLKRRRQVETRFRNNLKKDRARTRVGSISQFGLLEMTRQRMRPSLASSLSSACTACAGRGHVKSPESVVLDVMRRLALVLSRSEVVRAELIISPDAAFQLLNRKRGQLVELETRYGKPVTVRVGGPSVDFVDIRLFDERGGQMEFDTLSSVKGIAPPTDTTYLEVEGDELPQIDGLDFDEEIDEQAVPMSGHDEVEQTLLAPNEGEESPRTGKRKRRRRRRGRGQRADEQAAQPAEGVDEQTDVDESQADESSGETAEAESVASDTPEEQVTVEGADAPKKKRRRRRGGRGRKKKALGETDEVSGDETGAEVSEEPAEPSDASSESDAPPVEPEQSEAPQSEEGDAPPAPVKKKNRRGRGRKKKAAAAAAAQASQSAANTAEVAPSAGNDGQDEGDGSSDAQAAEAKRPKRRRRRGGKSKSGNGQAKDSGETASGDGPDAPNVSVEIKTGSGYSNRMLPATEPAGESS